MDKIKPQAERGGDCGGSSFCSAASDRKVSRSTVCTVSNSVYIFGIIGVPLANEQCISDWKIGLKTFVPRPWRLPHLPNWMRFSGNFNLPSASTRNG
jgi:hypothetical protein